MILLCQQEANSEAIGAVDAFLKLKQGDLSAQAFEHEVESAYRKMADHLGALPEPYQALFLFCKLGPRTRKEVKKTHDARPGAMSQQFTWRSLHESVESNKDLTERSAPPVSFLDGDDDINAIGSPLGHGAGWFRVLRWMV